MRWLLLLALGCAGAASDGLTCEEDESNGWLCDATCHVCTCDGTVIPEPGTIGICAESYDP